MPGGTTGAPGRIRTGALRKQVPTYAVLRFLRIVHEHEITATFRICKVNLKPQGFAPGAIGDPLWVLPDGDRDYQPLTADMFARIDCAERRLP